MTVLGSVIVQFSYLFGDTSTMLGVKLYSTAVQMISTGGWCAWISSAHRTHADIRSGMYILASGYVPFVIRYSTIPKVDQLIMEAEQMIVR